MLYLDVWRVPIRPIILDQEISGRWNTVLRDLCGITAHRAIGCEFLGTGGDSAPVCWLQRQGTHHQVGW